MRHSFLTRLTLCTAGGILAATIGATPAAPAAPAAPAVPAAPVERSGSPAPTEPRGHRGPSGLIAAYPDLRLRAAPTTRSATVITVRHGKRVQILCRTHGQRVRGSSVWYLLHNGYYAWAPASAVRVTGRTPERC